MPNFTKFFKLRKPLPEEFYNIEEHNNNMDIIDDALKVLSEDSGVVISPDEPETGDVWIDTDDDDGESDGAVTSVNGKTGDVSLTAKDVDAYSVGETYSKAEVNSLALLKSGGTMNGTLIAQNNTAYTTKQVRNIFLIADGASLPSGGNGDICLVYEV